MANPEHLAILLDGVESWNNWRERHKTILPDLRRADLRLASLCGVMLNDANLCKSDLAGADLKGAKLRGATLGGADLTGADLRDSDFSGAHMGRSILDAADFSGARLHGTNLYGADIGAACFRLTRIAWTVFGNVDLSGAIALDTVIHAGPSSIGTDTILQSKGAIPEGFLRGAGLPEEVVAYTRSLVGKPKEFYSCFISHSTEDREFAEQLHADFQDKRVPCWFAPHDIESGKKLHEQIGDAIGRYEKLLLIISRASMNSPWVETEIRHALAREKRENGRMLFPIRLVDFETIQKWTCFNADTGKDMAVEIREYFIPDFSDWKTDQDAYTAALARLLKDLENENERRV